MDLSTSPPNDAALLERAQAVRGREGDKQNELDTQSVADSGVEMDDDIFGDQYQGWYDRTVQRLAALDQELFVVKGAVGPPNKRIKAQFVLDSAASRVYLSAALAKQIPQAFHTAMPPARIALPNGNVITSSRGVLLPIKIGAHEDQQLARVLDMQEYDVILGLRWFQQYNPQVDWINKSVQLKQQVQSRSFQSYSRVFKKLPHLDDGADVEIVASMMSAELHKHSKGVQYMATLRKVEGATSGTAAGTYLAPTPSLPISDDPAMQDLAHKYPGLWRDELPDNHQESV